MRALPLLCLSAVPLLAQRDPRAAQPERPTVATHAGTVARGWLEIETGVELDHGRDPEHVATGVLVAKLGLGARLQLSLAGSTTRPSDNVGGLGDFSAGLKWRLLERQTLLGDFAIQPSLKVPTGSVSRGSGSGTTDASLLLISSRDAGPVHIDLNAGLTLRDGRGDRAPTRATVWTASFSGVVVGRLQWTAEVFGYPGTGGPAGAAPTVAVLAGPTFAARDWLVFDIGGIVPVAGGQPRAAYAGAVVNLGRVWGNAGSSPVDGSRPGMQERVRARRGGLGRGSAACPLAQ